jgi:hypothetical protein
MTLVAQTADEVGFAFAWLVDHFHTTPQLKIKSHGSSNVACEPVRLKNILPIKQEDFQKDPATKES